MFKNYRFKDYDFKLILLVVTLSVIGVLAVGSAKEDLLVRQIAGVCAGIVIMLFLPYLFSVMQSSALSTLITMLLNITLVYHYR